MPSQLSQCRIAHALLALTLLLACGPGGDPETGQSTTLYVLDEAGFARLEDDTRTLLVARPQGAFILDAEATSDGSRVALSIQGEPVQTEQGYDFGIDLYVAEAGREPRPLALHERIGEVMSRPNWLYGNDEIIFGVLGRDESGDADLRIEAIDVASGTRVRLIEDAHQPSLSPDGSTLAYVAIDQQSGEEVIMLRDMGSGASHALLPPSQVMFNVANIAWRPDGERLAFAAADPVSLRSRMPSLGTTTLHPRLRDIWVAGIDGSGLERLTELADASLSLAWKDQRHIYALGDTGFWLADAESGEMEKLGDGVLEGRVQTVFGN